MLSRKDKANVLKFKNPNATINFIINTGEIGYVDENLPKYSDEELEVIFNSIEFKIFIIESENKIFNKPIIEKLKEIDLKSIRSIREWIASQETASDWIKKYETAAIEERAKLK